MKKYEAIRAVRLGDVVSLASPAPSVGQEARPSDPEAATNAASEPLTAYLRDIARGEVMSREQEGALAVRIHGLRCSLWHTALGYPPFVAGIGELAREVLPASRRPTAALEAMTLAARKLRDRDLLVHLNEYRSARETLSRALAEADLDNLVIDRLLADLIGIEAGEHSGLSMRVKQPPRGSLPFLSYVHGVRREYQALWVARDEFVRANLRLVVTVARRYSRHMPLPDLIQEGNLGLMKAVSRFDPRRGYRFSTYGIWWIRHAMTRAIADRGRTVRLPIYMLLARNRVLRARQQFEARHGRPARDVELAETCGVSLELLAAMRFALLEAPVSLDLRLAADPERTLVDALEDTSARLAPEAIDHKRLVATLQELLAGLPPFEADILRKRTGMDGGPEMTLRAIGERHGLSRERIRQLQEQALTRLRAEFDRRRLL